MKRNYIIKGLSVLASLALLPACSSSYLDLEPESNVPETEALATYDRIQLAINGVCSGMYTQYQATSWNQYNGEPYVNTMINEGLGQDCQVGLAAASFGYEAMKADILGDPSTFVNNVPWDYCYSLIQQCNKILDAVDDAQGTPEQIAGVKAQALTLRAHAYTKLLGYFAPRWEDSNNGEVYCAVLRTTGEVENMPLATMNQILNQIYSDLDSAIELFDQSTWTREAKWQVNKSIAQGVYSRAALLKNDWAKAKDMAHAARQGYTIMDEDTYLSGFYRDNNDFMWVSSSDEADIYYWSWGSHFASNGNYVRSWGEGAGAIDMDLYRQLDENDIRRQCYITPDKIAAVAAVNSAWNPARISEDAFWNEKLVDPAHSLNLAFGPSERNRQDREAPWGLYNVTVRYIDYYLNNIFKGNMTDIVDPSSNFYAYFTVSNSGRVNLGGGRSATLVLTPFGAQLKFMSVAPYGVSAYCYMRASEMALNEAEAAYHLGDEATAIACLTEINSKRIPGYSCNKSGEALFNEYTLTRRIELWGEGFNFTDFKRWNMDINRRAWESGNVESGNWVKEFATENKASDLKRWMMTVPDSESDYNPAVDRNLLPNYLDN